MDKVLKIAKSEVGYLEKKSKASLDDKTENAGSSNYTKYWKDLAPGMQGQPWCNCFVNWCFVKAYGENEAKNKLCTLGQWSYYTPTSASYFKNNGRWNNAPHVGDVIYFKNSQRIHHVGIVYDVDDTYVYTIEGNTSSSAKVVANGGGVFEKKYKLNNSSIAGYGRPDYSNNIILPTQTLKKGSKGANVANLQHAINAISHKHTLAEDGDFGAKTESAICDVQKLLKVWGLYSGTIDGIYGKKTRNGLCVIAQNQGLIC